MLCWLQGFGPMAVNIFAREAQAAWEELFPFADERTLGMAKDHGLPGSAKELAGLVDNDRHKYVRLLAGEQGCYCSALWCNLPAALLLSWSSNVGQIAGCCMCPTCQETLTW